jgi:serine/threonine-protein kinase HipA
MALHFVGETIDPKQAHLRAQAGELTQLMRGIYFDDVRQADADIFAHAVRIARFLYPRAYLSGPSSTLLAPTSDGRLFIAGRRNQRTRLRNLEIIQTTAPDAPSTVQAIVADDLGEFRVSVSTPAQRLLEAFRLRSEQAAAISEDMRRQTADRLTQQHGSAKAAADTIWQLARALGWTREAEEAERYLINPREGIATANRAALNFTVAWHGDPLGHLVHDGVEWRWAAKRSAPPLVRQIIPGKLPAFIESLLPEGWLAQVVRASDDRAALRSGRRYMSNIAIVEEAKDLDRLPLDVRDGQLAEFSKNGRFTGRYSGPGRQDIETSFEAQLARLYEKSQTPRLSGVQIKAPMCLTSAGSLVPADNTAFTHILKPAGSAGFDLLPVVEWYCLELARSASFEVAAAALVEMPDGLPPALVVERFDIRSGPGDRRKLAMEDFCSLLDLPPESKYDGTLEQAAKAMRPLSTDSSVDIEVLFRRMLFAWLIADGDMHLKNLSLLKIMKPGSAHFDSVRMSPVYDAVTTQVFPGLETDRMAMKINGRDARLSRKDFLTAARTIGLPVAKAEAALADLPAKVRNQVAILQLPTFAKTSATSDVVKRIAKIVEGRASALA